MNVKLVFFLSFAFAIQAMFGEAAKSDDVSIRLVGAYESSRSTKDELVPKRVILQRGHDLFIAVEVPQSEKVRKLEIEGASTATFRVNEQEFKLALESKSKQSITTQANRRGALQLCYSGIPNCLLDGTLRVRLRVVLNDRELSTELVTNLVLVESRPINPGLVDGVDLVKEAVGYASGKQGKHEIAAALTEGLFKSNRFRYDDKAAIQAFDTASGSANLKLFNAEQKSIPVNCYQISTYLGLLCSSVGIESELREIVLDPEGSNEYAILTSPAISLGSPTNGDSMFEPIRFYSHQFLLCENLVYDASYRILRNPEGKDLRGPVLGWTLKEYLGNPFGNGGSFITGLPSGKPAKLFINAGEIPVFKLGTIGKAK